MISDISLKDDCLCEKLKRYFSELIKRYIKLYKFPVGGLRSWLTTLWVKIRSIQLLYLHLSLDLFCALKKSAGEYTLFLMSFFMIVLNNAFIIKAQCFIQIHECLTLSKK